MPGSDLIGSEEHHCNLAELVFLLNAHFVLFYPSLFSFFFPAATFMVIMRRGRGGKESTSTGIPRRLLFLFFFLFHFPLLFLLPPVTWSCYADHILSGNLPACRSLRRSLIAANAPQWPCFRIQIRRPLHLFPLLLPDLTSLSSCQHRKRERERVGAIV